MNVEEIGKLIQELRKEKNMTQEQLGNKLHVDRKTISKWETGLRIPDVTIIKDIAAVFDISIEELLSGKRTASVQDPDLTISTIKFYCDRYKKDLIKIFMLLVSIVLLGLIVFFQTASHYDYRVYNLSTDRYDITIDGYLIKNFSKNVVIINKIEYRDNYVGTDKEIRVLYVKISLKDEDETLVSKSLEMEEPDYISRLLEGKYLSYNDDTEKVKIKDNRSLKLIIEYRDLFGKQKIVETNIILD